MRVPIAALSLLFITTALASCGGGGTNGTGAAGASGAAGATAGTGGSTAGRGGTVGSAGTGGSAGSVGTPGTGGSGQGGTGGAGPSCATGRVLCGTECVDTTGDPRHCGGCGVACGANQVCASSGCQAAGDCRQTPCAGFSYCDLANGQCKPGCALDTSCTADETCDIATHACLCKTGFNRCGGTCVANSSGLLGCGTVCATCPTTGATAFACSGTSCVATTCSSGYHLCSGSCVANSSVASCGTSCTPCTIPPNGAATCNGTTCGITCNTGTMSCGGTCAVCPTTGATAFACSGTSCVATTCAATGYRLCSGVCGACPTAQVSTTTCSGTSCVPATCTSGYHICSGACVSNASTASCGTTSCTACPTVANGTATCSGTACGITCATGSRLCGGVCALCPTPAATTTCSGSTCVAATCATNQHICSGTCAANSSPNSCGTSCTACPAGPANSAPDCYNSMSCTFLCYNGWVRCGSACCADCRQMSGVCSGLDWCSDVNGLCAPVEKLQPGAGYANPDDLFGRAVAISGSLIAVGMPADETSRGSLYVFERISTGPWREVNRLRASTPLVNLSYFGAAVALSGTRLLVGSYGESTSTGAVYILERSGTTWPQQAKLLGEAAQDEFGSMVALDGDRAIVGARNNDSGFTNSGAAYIYERSTAGTWPATGIKLVASNRADSTLFGASVSISGDRALIGSGDAARSAYVFARQSDGTWIEEQILTTTGTTGDHFGREVMISGDRALVGANGDTDLGTNAGAVYVFERQSNGVWMETAKLHAPAPNAGPGDLFGNAVWQQGTRVLVGAPGENRSAAAAGTLAAAGAAYIFQRNTDGTWTAGVEIGSIADHVIANRNFGEDVAMSGDYALMGASTDLAGAPITNYKTGTAYVADMRSILP